MLAQQSSVIKFGLDYKTMLSNLVDFHQLWMYKVNGWSLKSPYSQSWQWGLGLEG